MKDETKVFQWLKEQNAPFEIQLVNFTGVSIV